MANEKKKLHPDFPKMRATSSAKKTNQSGTAKMPDLSKWNHHLKNHVDENGNWKPKLREFGLNRWKESKE